MIQIDLKGFSGSSGSTFDAPAAARDQLLGRFLIRWVTGSRNSYVNCLSPKAKAGQAFFSVAQDAAKIRLSGVRN